MLLKHLPEDFIVKEVLKTPLRERGAFAVYKVVKRGLSTPEVLQALAHRLSVSPSMVSSPALKDSRSVSTQHLSVGPLRGDPPQRVSGKGFSAELLGFLDRRLGPKDLGGNLFRITLRRIGEKQLDRVLEGWHKVLEGGFPNYFDLQRFGSWSPRGGFPGKALLLGQWEEVLRFYLLYPMLGDPKETKRLKERLVELWGRWEEMKERLPRSNLRSVTNFLCSHPSEFKKAVNLITPRILSLWLSAYQSFLWNQWASRWLKEKLAERAIALLKVRFLFQELVFPKESLPRELVEKLCALELPLPSQRARLTDERLKASLEEVLKDEGLFIQDLKVRGLKRAYLPRGQRQLWVKPKGIAAEPMEDEVFKGCKALVLEFFLPPGSYATMAFKTLRLAFLGKIIDEGLWPPDAFSA